MKDTSIAIISFGATALGLSIWALPAERDHPGLFSVSHDHQEPRELILEREFPLASGGQLDVDVADGDIVVTSHTGDGARVRVYLEARDMDWGQEAFDRMQFEATGSQDRVDIRARDPRLDRNDWRQHGFFTVTVEIDVPRAVHADVSTEDGDVRLAALTGRVNVASSDGDIAVEAVDGPEVVLQTDDGDVWVETLTAPRIEITTQDGDVHVGQATGELLASSGDGDITVTLTSAAATTLRTGDGDITIDIGTLGVEIDLSGEEVAVIPMSEFDGEYRNRWIRGTLRGGGPKITAETGDGSITLRAR